MAGVDIGEVEENSWFLPSRESFLNVLGVCQMYFFLKMVVFCLPQNPDFDYKAHVNTDAKNSAFSGPCLVSMNDLVWQV